MQMKNELSDLESSRATFNEFLKDRIELRQTILRAVHDFENKYLGVYVRHVDISHRPVGNSNMTVEIGLDIGF